MALLKKINRSLLKGTAALLDLSGTSYSSCAKLTLHTSDEAAIKSDWNEVGNDLWWAVDHFRQKTPTIRINLND